MATFVPPYIIRLLNGDDVLYMGSGWDHIRSGHGNDRVHSGAGHDDVRSGTGNDTVDAGHGDDFVNGGAGDDVVIAGAGNDTIYGGSGDDVIFGTKGNNKLRGGDGSDVIHSGKHASKLYGDKGDDHLIADLSTGANHTLWGGEGADTFEFVDMTEDRRSTIGVCDFELGVDRLVFDGVALEDVADELVISGNAHKTFVETPWGDQLVLRRVGVDEFEAYLDSFAGEAFV